MVNIVAVSLSTVFVFQKKNKKQKNRSRGLCRLCIKMQLHKFYKTDLLMYIHTLLSQIWGFQSRLKNCCTLVWI